MKVGSREKIFPIQAMAESYYVIMMKYSTNHGVVQEQVNGGQSLAQRIGSSNRSSPDDYHLAFVETCGHRDTDMWER